MLVKKNKEGQKLLLPAQIAKIYNVSRPTAGKWAEMAASGENSLKIYHSENRIFVIDNEANHKELNLLREKGVKYKNRSEYEKFEINNEFIDQLDDNSKALLLLAFENKQLPLKFTFKNTPELFGNELEFKKDSTKKQQQQFKSFIELFCNQQDSITNKILSVYAVNSNLLEALAEALTGYQDEPILNVISPNQSNLKGQINTDLFKEINYIESDLETQNLVGYLHTPIKNSHLGNLILIDNYLINKSFDTSYTFSNLAKVMTNRDYIIFNIKVDSLNLDLFANTYFNSLDVIKRNQDFLTKIGISEDRYTLEYKYNETVKSHQYVLCWTKEIDFVFGGQNLFFKEGENIVLEQLNCFSQESIINIINQSGLEVVQMTTNLNLHEIWFIVRKK